MFGFTMEEFTFKFTVVFTLLSVLVTEAVVGTVDVVVVVDKMVEVGTTFGFATVEEEDI